MPITKLDHVNIRTHQLDIMIGWYGKVLGLQPGKRPDFPFAGAWLYAGDQAVVHLIEIQNDNAMGSEADLKLEHFAFSAQGLNAFEDNLKDLDIPFRRSGIAEFNLVQMNIWDPDGNHIHVDFKDED